MAAVAIFTSIGVNGVVTFLGESRNALQPCYSMYMSFFLIYYGLEFPICARYINERVALAEVDILAFKSQQKRYFCGYILILNNFHFHFHLSVFANMAIKRTNG